MTKLSLNMLVAAAISLIAMNCANKGNGLGYSPAGKYTDKFTVQHEVSDDHWNLSYPGVGTCERSLIKFDRTAGTATYVEGGTNCFNAAKYGKLFFVSDNTGSFWYCDYLSGKTTANEVSSSLSQPDSTSPASSGCNGKAWGKLAPTDANFSLVGSFTDNYGGSQIFTNTLWTGSYGTPCTYAIIFYDNVNGFFIYQQQADAGCTAGNNYKFGKVFWGVDSTSKLYYCELLFGQSSYLTVANSTSKPTYGNPSATGCSGFSWTQLIR